MRRAEVRAVGDVAGTVLRAGVGLLRDVHLSMAERAFAAIGPIGQPAKLAHDGVSRVAYRAVGEAQRWAPAIGAHVAAAATSPRAQTIHSSNRGNVALGAINGLWGDALADAENELVIQMTVRHGRADVGLERTGVRAAFPGATPRLAIFVHGLCETEDAWYPSERKQRKHGAFSFGERLTGIGWTPVYIRYNSGLHISDNGARLTLLLEQLTEAWPVAVEQIALIGHSMGGLVARSACHQAEEAGSTWVDRTRHLFTLGTPHFGAPLERGVNALSWTMRRLPELSGLAAVLNARSAGIKDLRFGSLLEEDWRGVDLDDFRSGRVGEVPFSSHINYYFIGVTITKDRYHPLGIVAGDLLVQFSSASGRSKRRELPFDIDKGHHVGGLTHFDLLAHPDVYAQLEHWLTVAPPALPVPALPAPAAAHAHR